MCRHEICSVTNAFVWSILAKNCAILCGAIVRNIFKKCINFIRTTPQTTTSLGIVEVVEKCTTQSFLNLISKLLIRTLIWIGISFYWTLLNLISKSIHARAFRQSIHNLYIYTSCWQYLTTYMDMWLPKTMQSGSCKMSLST